MKFLAIVCVAVLGSVPVVSGAQDLDAKAALRSLPSERSSSLVLTAQGAERLAPPASSEGLSSLRFELEPANWTRAQSLALLVTAAVACSVTRLGCVAMPPAQPPITPPGSESWQRVGCKTPETCGWLWAPAINGPYPGPQQ